MLLSNKSKRVTVVNGNLKRNAWVYSQQVTDGIAR